jgi:hypothetical protein
MLLDRGSRGLAFYNFAKMSECIPLDHCKACLKINSLRGTGCTKDTLVAFLKDTATVAKLGAWQVKSSVDSGWSVANGATKAILAEDLAPAANYEAGHAASASPGDTGLTVRCASGQLSVTVPSADVAQDNKPVFGKLNLTNSCIRRPRLVGFELTPLRATN